MTEDGPVGRLPSYEHPPVVEVAMGVQFSRLVTMRQAHLGLFYERVRSEFPLTEDRPALPPTLDFLAGEPPALTFQLINSVEPCRAWFLTAEGDRLIQVQADRFVHNWRGAGTTYPRYASIRQGFLRHFSTFGALAAEEKLGPLAPEFAELNYINVIGDVRHVSEVLESLQTLPLRTPDGDATSPVEDRFGAVYALPDSSSGQLVLNAERLDMPGRPLGLTLTYRTRVRDIAELGSHFDRGHVTIVTAFDQFTSSAMHERWGKQP